MFFHKPKQKVGNLQMIMKDILGHLLLSNYFYKSNFRVHEGYIPKKRSFNLPSRTKKTLFRKLFEASEMAICENSNVEYDAKEKVALVSGFRNSYADGWSL